MDGQDTSSLTSFSLMGLQGFTLHISLLPVSLSAEGQSVCRSLTALCQSVTRQDRLHTCQLRKQAFQELNLTYISPLSPFFLSVLSFIFPVFFSECWWAANTLPFSALICMFYTGKF